MLADTFLAGFFLGWWGTGTPGHAGAGTCRVGALGHCDTVADGDRPVGTGLPCLPITHGPSPSALAAVGFISEDEYLEITGITREQSGEYECSASNDVAAPVVQRVKVTVNCE